jgi:3-hydroxyisobutyrate dehydrogenase
VTTKAETQVGIIGLGKMGLEMARALEARDFSVIGYDVDPARHQAAGSLKLTLCEAPSDVFNKASNILLSLPAAKDVEGVLEKAQTQLKERSHRAIVVDTTTSDPQVSRQIARELEKLGHGFLDAPVSGGPTGASSGTLTMMIGGKEEDLALVRPVIEAVASKILHVGSSGAGNVAKLVNNLLVAAHVVATSEGLRLASAAGVSSEAVLSVINAATGRSAISEIHFPKFILSNRFDSGFSMGLMRKDVRLALSLADQIGIDLPLARLVAELWTRSVERLSNDEDFTRMGAMSEIGMDE